MSSGVLPLGDGSGDRWFCISAYIAVPLGRILHGQNNPDIQGRSRSAKFHRFWPTRSKTADEIINNDEKYISHIIQFRIHIAKCL